MAERGFAGFGILMPRQRLVLFSAAERRYCEPLLRGFAERHPDIDVDFVFGISTDLHRRYLEDVAAGRATADLFWSSAMDLQMTLVLEGHVQPHGVRHDLPAGAVYRDLALTTTSEPLFTLTRDASAPASTPGEIAALLASDLPRFRGRIAVLDIEINGLGFLAMMCWALEQPKFDEFMDVLASCEPRAVGSAPALIAAMSQGAELALHLLGAYAERTVAVDSSLHLAPSAAPPISVGRVAFIPRPAANPEAASTFLSYMVSPAGQAAIGECGLFPLAAPSRTATAPIPINDGFSRFLDPASRASLLARWRAAVGRSEEHSRRKHA